MELGASAELVQRIAFLDAWSAGFFSGELDIDIRVNAFGKGRLVFGAVGSDDHPATLVDIHGADQGRQVRRLVAALKSKFRRELRGFFVFFSFSFVTSAPGLCSGLWGSSSSSSSSLKASKPVNSWSVR